MPLMLNHKSYGESGKPIVILHGLFGSSSNWSSVARALSEQHRVFALDLRNHGYSPHSDSHTMEDMIMDLRYWMDEVLSAERPIFMGHSMGGLVAALFALEFPSEPEAVAVFDIAPRAYSDVQHGREFDALRMNVSRMKTRQEVDDAMSETIPSPDVRRFLQMNLERNGDESGFHWKINVDALERGQYLEQLQVPENGRYDGRTLFLFGEKSPYYEPGDRGLIEKHFPRAEIQVISEAGHWLHHSHQKQFLESIREWLSGLQA